MLNEAMALVVSDSPGAYLKPLVAGGGAQALLAKAVEALEKREAELAVVQKLMQASQSTAPIWLSAKGARSHTIPACASY